MVERAGCGTSVLMAGGLWVRGEHLPTCREGGVLLPAGWWEDYRSGSIAERPLRFGDGKNWTASEQAAEFFHDDNRPTFVVCSR